MEIVVGSVRDRHRERGWAAGFMIEENKENNGSK